MIFEMRDRPKGYADKMNYLNPHSLIYDTVWCHLFQYLIPIQCTSNAEPSQQRPNEKSGKPSHLVFTNNETKDGVPDTMLGIYPR